MSKFLISSILLLLIFQFTFAGWSEPVPHPELNDYVNGYGAKWPAISTDKLTLFFIRQFNNEQYGTSEYSLFEATRETPSGPFTEINMVTDLHVDGHSNYLVSIWLSNDGLRLYYAKATNFSGSWERLIFLAERQNLESEWQDEKYFSELLTKGKYPSSLSLTANELMICWIEDDVVMTATRPDRNSSFGNIRELTEISALNPGNIHISRDGLRIYVSTTELEGLGKPNIYVGSRESFNQPFGSFEHLDNITDPLNGGVDQYLSPDESTIFFGSARLDTVGHVGIFESSRPREPHTWHVDGTNGSNTNEGTSRELAFRTIQHAAYQSGDGDTILVWPGVYRENVYIFARDVNIQGASDAPVISPAGANGITFSGSSSGDFSRVKNLVIRNCDLGIVSAGQSMDIANLTVVDNEIGLLIPGTSVTYSCLFCNNSVMDQSESLGFGNLHCDDEGIDPLFADPENGDYHLKSEYGRFIPQQTTVIGAEKEGLWVLDDETSPAIDAGHSLPNPVNEPMDNGGRINAGAFGNTAYASRSLWPLKCDLNKDGRCDFDDFVIFSDGWMSIVGFVIPAN